MGTYALGRLSVESLECAQGEAAAVASAVLLWWTEHESTFPAVCELASRMALFLTSSACVERLFSVWKRLAQDNMHEDAWSVAALAEYNEE